MAATHRRAALRAGLALGVGCLAPPVRACEYFSSTLRVLHPWARATAEDATFALLCMSFDEVSVTDRLIGVETPVAAGAELAGLGAPPGLALLIPAGQDTVLSETGLHIRLVGLKHPLEAARSYPLRLIFETGGVVGASLNVDYARLRFS